MDNLDQTTPAAEYAQDQLAQRVLWARMEWWNMRGETAIVAVQPGADGFSSVRQVGGLFTEVRQ
jgi:hypothetical protein